MQTITKKRILLILFGFIAVFAVLEAGMQIGGYAYRTYHERLNRKKLSHKGTYRIMCIGESTTASVYPQYLEEILNRKNLGIRFSVINKGMIAVTTDHLLFVLEDNIKLYKPDMIVAMMGINDGHQDFIFEKIKGHFYHKIKIYRLGKLLYYHIKGTLPKNEDNEWLAGTKNGKHGIMQAINHLNDNEKKAENKNDDVTLKRKMGKVEKTKEKELKQRIRQNENDNVAIEKLAQLYNVLNRYKEAEEVCKTQMGIQRGGAAGLYIQLGISLNGQKKYGEAEEAGKKAIELAEKNEWAYMTLSDAYVHQEKYNEAEKVLIESMRQCSPSERLYWALGDVYEKQKRYEEWMNMYKKAVKINDRSDSYFAMGKVYLQLLKYKEAEAAVAKGIALDSNNIEGYLLLATAYNAQRRYHKAVIAAGKALALNPQDEQGYSVLGKAYDGLEEYEAAIDAYKKAIKIHATSKSYAALGAMYVKLRKYRNAKKAVNKALAIDPCDAGAYAVISDLYRHDRRYKEALIAGRRSMELLPRDYRGYHAMGKVYKEIKNPDSCIDMYNKAAKISASSDGYLNLSRLYIEFSMYKKAGEAAKVAIQLDPLNVDGHIALAEAYVYQLRYKEGEETARKAVNLGPQHAGTYAVLGKALAKQNRYQEALDLFKKSVNIYASSDIYLALSTAYLKLNQFEDAERMARAAIQLSPRDGKGYEVLASFYSHQRQYQKAAETYKKAADLEIQIMEKEAELDRLENLRNKGVSDNLFHSEGTISIGTKKIPPMTERQDIEWYAKSTIYNYQKLKRLVSEKGITLVCMQYPGVSIKPLKTIVQPGTGVFFVDNEALFNERVRQEGYDAYFSDMFGWVSGYQFGHCTPKGYTLMAQHLADIITQQVIIPEHLQKTTR